jgi:hypothetical protein
MDKGESLVEIKLSGWKKTFASGKKGVSLAIDTYVKSAGGIILLSEM